MSLPERRATFSRLVVAPALVLLAAALSACTVRPLYSTAPLGATGASAAQALSSVSIRPVSTRQAQEVRNHLIFLLGGGRGEPASPAYSMALSVISRTETAARVQVTDDENVPSAATVVMVATYTLTDTASGKVIGRGTRQISSAYDVPRQEFAALRAQRDAENRAAREVSELLRAAVVQDLARSNPG